MAWEDGGPAPVERPRIETDMSGYRREMEMSTAATVGLLNTVTSLQKRMDGTANRAGNRSIIAGLGLGAGLTAQIALAASYDKQLSRIAATNKVVGESTSKMKKDIDGLAKSLPVARKELIEVYKALQDLGVKSPRQLKSATDQILKLAEATGEAPGVLASGIVQLSRQMGTDGVGFLDKYSSALLNVSKQQGVTAAGTLNFAQSIAPFTRAVQISTTDTLGFAAAFEKAGADGFAASSTFNQLLADITRQIQYGSPEMAKYSNLIGVTTEQFAKMDKAEAVVRIFEEIGKQGPDAFKTLERLGFDGLRASKAITQVSQSAGGLRAALADAREGGRNPSLTDQAAAEAMKGVNDEGQKLLNTVEEIGKVWGDALLTPAEKTLQLFNQMLQPLAGISAALAPILAPPVAASALALIVGGGMLKAYKAATIAATGLYIGRSGAVQGAAAGFMAGRNDGRDLPRWAAGWQQANAAGQMTPMQSGIYGRAVSAGQMLGRGTTAGNAVGAGASAVASAPLRAGAWWWGMAAQGYRDARVPGYQRDPMFPGMVGAVGQAGDRARDLAERVRMEAAAAARLSPAQAGMSYERMMERRAQERIGASMAQGLPTRSLEEQAMRPGATSSASGAAVTQQTREWSRSMREANRETRSFGQNLGLAGRRLAGAVGSSTATAVGAGAGLAARGATAMGGLPMGLTVAAIGGSMLYSKYTGDADRAATQPDKLSFTFETYDEQLGRATSGLSSFEEALKAAERALPTPETMGEARRITGEDVAFAQANPDFTTPQLAGLRDVGTAKAWLASQQETLDPARLDLIKRDLIRALGEDQAQQVLSQYERMTPEQGRDQFNTAFTQGSTLPQRFGWPGLGKEREDLLGLSVAGLQQDFLKRQDEMGVEAANQFRVADAVKLLESTAQNGDQVEMDALVARLVDQGIIPKGMQGDEIYNRGRWDPDYQSYRDAVVGEWSAVSPEQVTGLKRGGFDIAASDQDMRAVAERTAREATESGRTLNEQIKRATRDSGLGAFALSNEQVLAAVDRPEDPQIRYAGITLLADEAKKAGGSLAAAELELRKHQAAIGDVTDEQYKLAEAARDLIRQQRTLALATQNRQGVVAARAGDFQAQMDIPEGQRGPTFVEDTEEARQNFEQAKEGYRQFLVGLLQSFRNYEVASARAAEDFNRSRRQANEDYYKSVRRSAEDFQRQMAYAEQDFYLSRERAQRDFNKQAARMAEDAAASIYDPYKRAQAQFTYGAESLLTNLSRQNQLIQDQSNAVSQLAGMGLSQEAINQLGLTDPQNRQQAIKLAEQLAKDPSMIAQFNNAIKNRLDWTKGLTQGENSEQWQRMKEDFETAANDAEEDFDRSMKRTREQYKLTLARGLEDFNTAMVRMHEQYTIAMRRQKEDLFRATEEIYGSFEDLADKAVGKIAAEFPGVGDAALKEIQRVRAKVRESEEEWKEFLKWQESQPHQGSYSTSRDGAGGYSDPRDRAAANRNPVRSHAGNIFTAPTLTYMAEVGVKEAAVPLSPTGANFMAEMVQMVVKQMSRTPTGGVVSGASGPTIVDQSQTIRHVEVVSQNPDEMAEKLKMKQRRKALTSPTHGRRM